MAPWFQKTLSNLGAALKSLRPTNTQRNTEPTIQTAARVTHIANDTAKRTQAPKLTHPTDSPMSPEEQQQMAAWQKMLEEPSNHQRLAPYA